MKCQEARKMLSAFHDGELPADRRVAVEVHVESCPRCAAELAQLRRLSELAASLDAPPPPDELRKRVLGETSRPRGGELPRRKLPTYGIIAPLCTVAAAALIITAVGIRAWLIQPRPIKHVDLCQYWESFEANSLTTQREFLARYAGREWSGKQLPHELHFRPLHAAQLPDGIDVQSQYVLNMPCCKCVETIGRRPDGTMLAVFEHEQEEPGWFPGRSQISIQCADTKCRVVELGSSLAASWSVSDRVVTVIGLRDVDELTQWVKTLRRVNSARSSADSTIVGTANNSA